MMKNHKQGSALCQATAMTVVLSAALGLAACGSSAGDGEDDTAAIKTGKFIDAAVSGLPYTTSSGRSGTTSTIGEFSYQSGDSVSFKIGDILLGSATAQEILTPRALADNSTLPSGVPAADIATNLAVFLQTFDADRNPSNGITIPASVVSAAAGRTLNFSQPMPTFSSDATFTSLASQAGAPVVTREQAVTHTAATVRSHLAGSWRLKSTGSDLAVISLFTDGRYVLGIDHNDPNCRDGLELGQYKVNAEAGTFTVVSVSEDSTGPNGDCGLFEKGQGLSTTLKLAEQSFELSGAPRNEPNVIFERVAATNGVVGSWLIAGDTVITFFADGVYLLADDVGIERGKWSIGAGDKLTISNITVDTNDDAGLSDLEGVVTLKVRADGKLELNVSSEGIYLGQRLPLAGS